MTKNRARISILSELLSFPTINQKDWSSHIFEKDVSEGDLVSLCSAPDTKWYLSWVRDFLPNNGYPKYLLESIEDGELCWWENVGINVYDRKRVDARPTWKWSDKQFAFNDRWNKVCRRNDAFIVLPKLPKFEGKDVILDVRIRFSITQFENPKKFTNWKKITMKTMEEYYIKSVEKYNSTKAYKL